MIQNFLQGTPADDLFYHQPELLNPYVAWNSYLRLPYIYIKCR